MVVWRDYSNDEIKTQWSNLNFINKIAQCYIINLKYIIIQKGFHFLGAAFFLATFLAAFLATDFLADLLGVAAFWGVAGAAPAAG